MHLNNQEYLYREHYIELLGYAKKFDILNFQKTLSNTHLKLSSNSFIIDFIAPFVNFIGLSWENEDISISVEHFCTDQILKFIYGINIKSYNPQGTPKVLLTTIPNEFHSIGIAMAELIISLNGGDVLSLSSETPHSEIVSSAVISNSNIVGLSFSGHINSNHEEDSIIEIVRLLPKNIDLWVGGSPSGNKINDVKYLGLNDIQGALNEWRLNNIYLN